MSLRIIKTAAASLLVTSAACSRSRAEDAPKTKIGVNVSTIYFWDNSRPFKNLIYGASWEMRDANGAGMSVPPGSLDPNGWIKALPAGAQAVRALSVPSVTADIVCRWDGDDRGSMQVSNSAGPIRGSRTPGARELRFRYASSYPGPLQPAYLRYSVHSQNYVRNLDCREASSDRTEVFDPAFVSTLEGFSVIRFMKWQTAVEANRPVTWATRNKPGDGDYIGNDGVPIETMVALANKVGADPWFSMPWNADDDYVTRFAAYVRDNLATGHRAYVEVSNEVWNGNYPVMRQAEQEGIAEGLDASQGQYGQAMYRYAEKTQHVMQLWSKVFAGRMDRLVRVASAQNVSPFWSEQILGYRGTAENVDALATAPYWMFSDEDFKGQSLDRIMGEILPRRLSDSLDWAAKQKAVARKFGKRYIAYEGGQHVWLDNDQPLVARIERDPRMFDLYKAYTSRWDSQIGDTLTFFTLTGGIGKAGFGLVQYPGQPLSETPKMRAVQMMLHRRGNQSSLETQP